MRDPEVLGIQYIHGQLSADVLCRKKAVRSWECPDPVLEEDALAGLLSKIPGLLNFEGACASMIICSPAIDYQVIKIPPMKKRDLARFLAWKAESTKGNAFAWSYTKLDNTNREGSVYLHLAPAAYRAMFLKFCEANQYDPLHLVTLASVTPDLLLKGEDTGGKVEMVAAVVGQSTFIAVGVKNAPLFIREFPYSWNSPGQNTILQFAREIKRTVIFTRQQYKKEVVRLRILGPDAQKTREAFSDLTGVDIDCNDGHIKWLQHVYLSSPRRTDNLLPPEFIGQGARRRRISGIIAALCAAFVVLTVACIALGLYRARTDALAKQSNLAGSVTALSGEIARLNSKKSEIERNLSAAQLIEARRLEPIPGWFSLFAAEVLPYQLTLTRLSVTRDDNAACWNVLIEGTCPANNLRAAKLLDHYQSRLSGDLVNLSPNNSWRLQWIENLKVSGGPPDAGRPFRVTGIVR